MSDSEYVSFVPMEDLGITQKYLEPTKERCLSDVIGSYTYFADGDVLLAKITPCFENGKLGIARGLVNGIGFGSSEYFVLRPQPSVTSEWLYYFLARSAFRAVGATRMTGAVGHKRVEKEFIESCPIPVPPLEEQRRITALLDKSFQSLSDALSAAADGIHRADALFDSYRHSVFVAQKGERPTTTLDRIATNLDSKRVPITKADRRQGAFPYYGASGIVDYVSDYIFDGDTLLVSEDGANLLSRSTPIAFSVTGKYWVNNHAHVLKFNDSATQRYVEFYLESISLQKYVTGAAQPKLTQKALNSIPIPLPATPAERADIVKRMQSLESEAQRLRALYESKSAALEELRESLLHTAFSGTLLARS
ncbi:restriction modification system DNA specificity domain [Anaeromyxobacter sp. K]|nr:restriction modification system DNA specificity domain [Anaeromyxobacter sp. K]